MTEAIRKQITNSHGAYEPPLVAVCLALCDKLDDLTLRLERTERDLKTIRNGLRLRE